MMRKSMSTNHPLAAGALAFAALGTVLGMAGTAFAGPVIHRREANQERRIDQGVRSGSLTAPEAARLEAGQARSVDHGAVADHEMRFPVELEVGEIVHRIAAEERVEPSIEMVSSRVRVLPAILQVPALALLACR